MSVIRPAGIVFAMLALGAAVHDRAASDAPPELVDSAASSLARQARDALLTLESDPNDTTARETGLAAFRSLFGGAGWELFSPDTTTIAGEAMLAMIRLAESGDAACLETLMDAAQGPYGRTTVEGSEWLNEVLWNLLAGRTQLTLDVLAQLEPEDRSWLVDNVYTQPVHDGFDFAGIRERLRTATIPRGLDPDVRRMLEAVERSSPR